MLSDIVEVIGPVVLKILAALACLVAFAPLLLALIGPALG